MTRNRDLTPSPCAQSKGSARLQRVRDEHGPGGTGETDLRLQARTGEVIRFFFVNRADTRIFNVRLPGARANLVGGDSGRYEHETIVDEVLLAPSERAIVDALFGSPVSPRDGVGEVTDVAGIPFHLELVAA